VHELEALARISEAVSESLYLEESLEAIVKTTVDALSATGAALVLEDGAIAWPEGRADTHAIRQPLRWRGRQIGELVADRPAPFTQHDRELLASIAQHAAVALEHGRAVMRGVLAQEIHHRVKNNLQTVASLLRLQLGSAGGPAAEKALRESVNRICSIAEVHDLLTSSRVDGVDCAGLIGRLQAMLASGLDGRPVHAALQPVPLRGDQATALALVFCELFSNAVEHGAGPIGVELCRDGAGIVLTVTDRGAGPGPDTVDGLGMTIARTLVRDQLAGALDLRADGGGKAVARFPAES
jgi:two-component sensor histidine kinase